MFFHTMKRYSFLKLLLFFSLNYSIIGFEIPQSIQESTKDLHKHCIEKTGVSIEHIHKCSEKAIPDDPDVKCYLACLHDNFDVDLEKRIAQIQTVEHKINDDVHGLVSHIKKECDDEYFGKLENDHKFYKYSSSLFFFYR